MVRGLDLFRERFKAFADRYVLIGGTACDLILEEAGLHFRATKDLDIVLCIESVDARFAQAFWAFVKEGGYQVQASAEGKPWFYRFQKPADPAYPAMLELFSRVPDALAVHAPQVRAIVNHRLQLGHAVQGAGGARTDGRAARPGRAEAARRGAG